MEQRRWQVSASISLSLGGQAMILSSRLTRDHNCFCHDLRSRVVGLSGCVRSGSDMCYSAGA